MVEYSDRASRGYAYGDRGRLRAERPPAGAARHVATPAPHRRLRVLNFEGADIREVSTASPTRSPSTIKSIRHSGSGNDSHDRHDREARPLPVFNQILRSNGSPR